jgi:hypothetical protein
LVVMPLPDRAYRKLLASLMKLATVRKTCVRFAVSTLGLVGFRGDLRRRQVALDCGAANAILVSPGARSLWCFLPAWTKCLFLFHKAAQLDEVKFGVRGPQVTGPSPLGSGRPRTRPPDHPWPIAHPGLIPACAGYRSPGRDQIPINYDRPSPTQTAQHSPRRQCIPTHECAAISILAETHSRNTPGLRPSLTVGISSRERIRPWD